MRSFFIILSCFMVLTACGKDDDNGVQKKSDIEQIENVQDKNEDIVKNSSDVKQKFFAKFETYTPAQKYYFCAAFAMGAMSVAKPVTASAMVNYFMGLGVAKYNEGINEENYKAFNVGKNVFRNEKLVNIILQQKTCENIMNEAADFARERNYHVVDLDKRGKKEVEKVVRFIKQKQK
ncbi:MAG: hypothetical protein IJ677_03190 [Alphaproteobacteria bacterium]|nr:hypothetical protein [Alphaproteobacteria bacterium]